MDTQKRIQNAQALNLAVEAVIAIKPTSIIGNRDLFLKEIREWQKIFMDELDSYSNAQIKKDKEELNKDEENREKDIILNEEI